MSIRIGIPSVGLSCFETSGLFLSFPPGSCSQATAPHKLPLHWATRMLATPSATRQSPVGSSARAGARPAAKNNPEYTVMRMMFRGRCNMGQTCASVSYTHLRAHEPRHDVVCRLLLVKKKSLKYC